MARETEGELVGEQDGILGYSGITLQRLDTVVAYKFNNQGELYGMNYMITERHSNPTAYITDYNSLKTLLVEKYGPPTEDKVTWLDDQYKDRPSDWGMAVIKGDLIHLSTWETEPVRIVLGLLGDNYQVSAGEFMLLYESKVISSDTGQTGTEGL